MHPGSRIPAGHLIDEVAGLEVVGAIDNHIDTREQVGGVGSRQIGHHWLQAGGGVDPGQVPCGCDGLRQTRSHVGLVEEQLPG